jgi:hypothetical protein
MTIKLPSGHIVLVSEEDFEAVSKIKWHIVRKAKGNYLYAAHSRRVDRPRHLLMHEVIAEKMGIAGITDHINGNTLDNRRENLRESSVLDNAFNRKVSIDSSSGVRNVLRHRDGKWQVTIVRKGKKYHKGDFNTVEEATIARDDLLKEIGREHYGTRDKR